MGGPTVILSSVQANSIAQVDPSLCIPRNSKLPTGGKKSFKYGFSSLITLSPPWMYRTSAPIVCAARKNSRLTRLNKYVYP